MQTLVVGYRTTGVSWHFLFFLCLPSVHLVVILIHVSVYMSFNPTHDKLISPWMIRWLATFLNLSHCGLSFPYSALAKHHNSQQKNKKHPPESDVVVVVAVIISSVMVGWLTLLGLVGSTPVVVPSSICLGLH